MQYFDFAGLCAHDCFYLSGERATHPIEPHFGTLAALLLLAGKRPAASSRLANAPNCSPLGRVQLRFLGSKDARDRFGGGIGNSRTAQSIATPHAKQPFWLLPPGRGKAGMGVECRHCAGQVSTPSPARLADRAEPEARLGSRRVGSTGPKHVQPPPLPGGGSNFLAPQPRRRRALFVSPRTTGPPSSPGRSQGLADGKNTAWPPMR